MNYVVITENDESKWKDTTGDQFHFPKRYLKFLQPGTKVLYYKGKLKNKIYKDLRLTPLPHYFGIAEVGTTYQDPTSEKEDFFCSLLNYTAFPIPVLAKDGLGELYERIPESRQTNYWRDGVRVITKEIYERIVAVAEIETFNDFRILEEIQIAYQEGESKTRTSVYYERSSALRQQVLSIHGYTCMGCEFNFEKTYGDWGKGYIHVHHLSPVSQAGITKPDPKTDFAVLCANCHSMVHRKKDKMLGLDDLKQLIDLQK